MHLAPQQYLLSKMQLKRDVEKDTGFAWSTMDNRGSSETAKPRSGRLLGDPPTRARLRFGSRF